MSVSDMAVAGQLCSCLFLVLTIKKARRVMGFIYII